ncbi:U-box domain containing protein [Nitzschia inconspicua]|uniref:U-box domain containing protein n=1 Tax=Nitzschia inconspicua TaxID=303405 RepID=A0A9K3L5H6_9STRA|nr:U-box domain containing protein [Nitzschia inconspicua]
MVPYSLPCIFIEETDNSDDNSSLSEDVVDDIPEEFICPLTLCVMKDPVVSKDGINYNRTAIVQWLAKGNHSCPLTRQSMKLSSLAPDNRLRKCIQQWRASQEGQAINNKRQFQQPNQNCCLASLDLVMGLSNDKLVQKEARLRKQPQQPKNPSSFTVSSEILNLLALYDEIIALSEGPSSIIDTDENTSDLEALVETELGEIKEMYEDILKRGQIKSTGTQS